jgi:hypothetical protein
MGYGCYYTNKETETRAFWVEVDYEDDQENEFAWNNEILNLQHEFESLGYEQENEHQFYNGLFNIILESGHGGKIVVRLEPICFESNLFNLSMAIHEKSYTRIGKHLKKQGYPLRIASSRHTSMEY